MDKEYFLIQDRLKQLETTLSVNFSCYLNMSIEN